MRKETQVSHKGRTNLRSAVNCNDMLCLNYTSAMQYHQCQQLSRCFKQLSTIRHGKC